MSANEQRSAAISPDGRYRYRLDRWWGEGERLVWVMLNPSTADATEDDPTIGRVRSFTKREGYAGFTVVNLFSLRATDPRDLRWPRVPLWGPEDGDYWHHVIRNASVIAAWGASAALRRDGPGRLSDLRVYAREVRCLGKTKAGRPRHPLYVKSDTALEAWS